MSTHTTGTRSVRSQVRYRSLQRNSVPALHSSALHDSSKYADISLIVLDNRAENARIFGQVALREGCHDAASTRGVDLQTYFVSDCKDLADPVVFHEAANCLGHLDDEVWPKASDVEATVRAQRAESLRVDVVTRWMTPQSKKVPGGSLTSNPWSGLASHS